VTVPKPRYPPNHPDRFQDCQRAIDDRMSELLDDAQAAGWTKEEVLAAMIEVAENTNLASKRVAFGRDRVEAIVKEMNV
jgi:hypothetical protein